MYTENALDTAVWTEARAMNTAREEAKPYVEAAEILQSLYTKSDGNAVCIEVLSSAGKLRTIP